ncbi:MAG: nitronate monooxygenase, partial [Bdellovibrionaceae bacterium]|nr:nitronate monooxygenase [Pseudobdellovibrionaceae bacterium]
YLGMKSLEDAATKASWKTVWSAGQSVGLIDSEESCRDIIENFAREYREAVSRLP